MFALSPTNSDHFENVHTKQNVQPRQDTTSTEHNVKKITDDQLNQYTSVSNVLAQVTGEEYSDTRREDKEKEEVVELVNGEHDFVDEHEEEFVYLELEEVVEERTELLSNEELNKKCEDFIRKMKFGLKFEAQHHQLIMV